MEKGATVPPENDADYLERVQSYIVIARNLKVLVTDLAVGDWSGFDYFKYDLEDPEVEDNGRLRERFQIMHSHYKVEPSGNAEINPVEEVVVSVQLARKEGGRFFYLNIYTALETLIEIGYYEDMPIRPGQDVSSEIIFNRFYFAKDGDIAEGPISLGNLKIIETLTSNLRAVQAEGRLTLEDESVCQCS